MCQIIEGTRYRIATTVNAEACLMNWSIGKRIKEDVLYNQRAEYGKEIVKNLSTLLTDRYGKGWGHEKLKHCIRSAYTFSEEEIGYAVRTQFRIWATKILKDNKMRRSPKIFVAQNITTNQRGVALKS